MNLTESIEMYPMYKFPPSYFSKKDAQPLIPFSIQSKTNGYVRPVNQFIVIYGYPWMIFWQLFLRSYSNLHRMLKKFHSSSAPSSLKLNKITINFGHCNVNGIRNKFEELQRFSTKMSAQFLALQNPTCQPIEITLQFLIFTTTALSE